MRPLIRRKITLSMVVFALLLTACSSTTFFYNRLDALLPWYVERFVDLERDQRAQLDQLLETFLIKHRREELPSYVAILDQALSTLEGPVTRAQVAEIYREGERAAARLQQKSLTWMLVMGAELSDAQIHAFIAELNERQQDYREEYLSRDDQAYRREIARSLVSFGKRYLGRLEQAQRTHLGEAAESVQRWDSIWYEERADMIASLESLLIERRPGWQRAVRDLLKAPYRRPEARHALDHNLAVLQGAVADLLNSRTERQDRHLRRELTGLRSDLVALMDEAEGAVFAQANETGGDTGIVR